MPTSQGMVRIHWKSTGQRTWHEQSSNKCQHMVCLKCTPAFACLIRGSSLWITQFGHPHKEEGLGSEETEASAATKWRSWNLMGDACSFHVPFCYTAYFSLMSLCPFPNFSKIICTYNGSPLQSALRNENTKAQSKLGLESGSPDPQCKIQHDPERHEMRI